MIKSFVCVCGLLVSLNVVAASLKPVKGKWWTGSIIHFPVLQFK